MTLRELHLFAGSGGGILGGALLGHRCVGAVEIDPYCRRVLEARQADGCLEHFPIHDDIRTFDGSAWRGRVDVVGGGFPCQDISTAGKGAGLDGERSGLWWEMHRVIREVGPRFVFVENVAALLVRGFDRVLGSLADLGFDAEWIVLSAGDCNAPHLRKRLWLLAADSQRGELREQSEPVAGSDHSAIAAVNGAERGATAHPDADGRRQQVFSEQHSGEVRRQDREQRDDADRLRDAVADTYGARLAEREGSPATRGSCAVPAGARWWSTEPRVGRVAHGVSSRVDRLRALGNAQVPVVAATAWRVLMRRMECSEGAGAGGRR